MLRQRLLSTDVLPLDSVRNIRPTRRLKSNRVNVSTQTLEMDITNKEDVHMKLDYSRQCYIPITMFAPHIRLQSILPIFPEMNEFNEFYPLLTNIP
ncbi:unnamed protein product, partial [Adineta steineri]